MEIKGCHSIQEFCDRVEQGYKEQYLIEQAGLIEEFDQKALEITGFKDFLHIFEAEPGLVVAFQMMMSSQEKQRYIEVCTKVQELQNKYVRKALEVLHERTN